MKKLWKICNSLWNLFYPRCCIVCGKPLLQTEEHLCLHCLNHLSRTNLHQIPENEMEKNLWGKMPIEKASAFLHYSKGGDVRRVLYELKYYGNKELGKMMGACMAREIQSSGFFRGIEGIIPVPLHPERERQRGYNQSEWIARGISEVTGIPVWEQIIVRSHFVSSQTHKSNLGRWESMQGQFRCLNKNKLIGKHILLVDDVMTTGATLVAVADSVQGVVDIKFSVLTLALAGQD